MDLVQTRRSKRLNKRLIKPVPRLIDQQSKSYREHQELLLRQKQVERKRAELMRAIFEKQRLQNKAKRESKEKIKEKLVAVKSIPKVSLKFTKPKTGRRALASTLTSSSISFGVETAVTAPKAPAPKRPTIDARTEIDLTSYSFGSEPKSTSSSKLDLVFCLDCTGSMGSTIQACKGSIVSLTQTIIASEGQDVRVCLIPYRDHHLNEAYCTKVYPFTRDFDQIQMNVNQQAPGGGGDGPEAVTAAMFEALCLDWRDDAAKVVIFMADAPPHGIENSGDYFPDGDPDGKDPLAIAREMISLGISVYSIIATTGFNTTTKDFFSSISALTGGQCLNLADASLLSDCIISGVKENLDIESKMQTVRSRIATETARKGSELTAREAEEITESVIGQKGAGNGPRVIAAEKIITVSQEKLEKARVAENIVHLRKLWSSTSTGSRSVSSATSAPVVHEDISARISRMAVAREARSTDRVMVECVKDGSKVRARVISDGYDLEKNCQFPREMREVGKRFLVDTVVDAGSFYRVKGNIDPI